MEERHEIIRYSNNIPIHIFLHRLGSVSKHWHENLEILYILSGTVHAIVDDQTYTLEDDDIIAINSYSVHELYSEGCEIVAFQITLHNFEPFRPFNKAYFNCCSTGKKDKSQYDFLRHILARLIKVNETGENILMTIALTSILVNELVLHYQTERQTNYLETQKHLDRMTRIMAYISSHFREGVTLNDLAESEHLSISYLSRFFQSQLGMSFTAYYNKIRLEHAVNEMLSSDEAIAAIAVNNGFPDARAFVSVFKKQYDMLPSEYRQQVKQPQYKMPADKAINYLDIESSPALSKLAKYLDFFSSDAATLQRAEDLDVLHLGTIDTGQILKPLRHTWHTMCCVGTAKQLLYGEIQDMLRQLQKDIGFKYVKFHGLLCDDMLLYDETEDGTPVLSYIMIDKVMDFLLSIGLRPLMQLSFTPSKMASDPERTTFYIRYNTSPPKNLRRWLWMIENLVTHLIERYTLKEVSQWLFCLWNEPDTSIQMFGFDSADEFFQLYKHTYQTIKNISAQLSVGTPSLMFISQYALNWDYRFLEYCRVNQCEPDFVNLHYYDDKVEVLEATWSPDFPRKNMLNLDENSFSLFIGQLKKNLRSFYGHPVPIYLTEWNLTVNHRNLINDTVFKSCYIAKNLLENYDRLESYGYWAMTDFLEESQLPGSLFHGGMGIFTMNSIPKPLYYVFKYLSRLGDQLIYLGQGCFITRSEAGIQLALYNYTHYTQLFANGELFDMTSTNRYTAFSSLKKRLLHLTLKQLTGARCLIREHYVNRSEGSSFDTWMEMGALPLTSAEDLEILRIKSQPGFCQRIMDISEGSLELSVTLEPLEFRFIELKYI